MYRAQFIELQTREADLGLSLTPGEEDAWGRFLQLAIDTYDFLVSAGTAPLLKLVPGANPPRHQWKRRDGRTIEFPPALIERWENWNRKYVALRARNPGFELLDMMREISESNNASSWPGGYERHIQAWVDAGDPSAPPPFVDRYDIVTPAFFNRLRELRRLALLERRAPPRRVRARIRMAAGAGRTGSRGRQTTKGMGREQGSR
jgi:hypothetical protein